MGELQVLGAIGSGRPGALISADSGTQVNIIEIKHTHFPVMEGLQFAATAHRKQLDHSSHL